MTTEHTIGPWRALPEECDKPYIRIRGTRLGGRYKVANVLTPVYDGVNQREAEETRANASLIAAAPNYHDAAGWILAAVATNAAPVNALAALEEMALDGKHVTLDAGLVLDLLKAHAKAKGEQQ